MGAWAAYEFLIHVRANGLPMPVKAFLSAMPHPDIPFEQRPWKQQASLDEAQFQVRLRSPYKVLYQKSAFRRNNKTQQQELTDTQRFAVVLVVAPSSIVGLTDRKANRKLIKQVKITPGNKILYHTLDFSVAPSCNL